MKGTLTGVGLARMHACLADRALTTKTLFAFLHDADPVRAVAEMRTAELWMNLHR